MTTYVLTITGDDVTRDNTRHTGDLINMLTGRLHTQFVSLEGPAAYLFSIDNEERETTLRDVLRGEWEGSQAVLTWLTVTHKEQSS